MKYAILAAIMLALAAMPAAAKSMKDMGEKAQYYLEKMDTNKDGKVSMEEHDSYGRLMFGEADTNNDNFLSREELEAHKKKEMDEKMESR